jgi:hypothetical protein
MSDKLNVNENLRSTKIYRSLDQADNLRIRVTLRKVADRSVPLAKGSLKFRQSKHAMELVVTQLTFPLCPFVYTIGMTVSFGQKPSNDNPTASILPPPIELIAKWQKKILSPR